MIIVSVFEARHKKRDMTAVISPVQRRLAALGSAKSSYPVAKTETIAK